MYLEIRITYLTENNTILLNMKYQLLITDLIAAVAAACSDLTSGNSASALSEANDGREPANRGVFGLELFEALLPLRFCGIALGRCIDLTAT